MKFLILFITILISSVCSYAQQSISGKVVSYGDSLPIAGANISVQGSPVAVNTDYDGNFTILDTVESPNVILEIKHVRYESSMVAVTLPQTDTLNIYLHISPRLLDEVAVVSTGYQRLPKERSTGSFSTVSKELFNQQIGTDILSRLPVITNSMVMDNGRQGTPQMMIRGLSTIRGPKDPLVIIDNFPYDGDITNINPNIVENITILKDASASSIWGARTANGVIVITTKKGDFNQPIDLSFNSNLTIGAKPDLSYIPQMSSDDYIDLESELFSRGFYDSQINSVNRPVISPVVDLLNKVKGGELSEEKAQQQMDQWREVDARQQIKQYLYRPSTNQQYFLSAQGGSEEFSWTSAVGFDNKKDNLGSIYQRTNLRFQNTYQPLKQLSLSTGILYTQNRSKSGRYGYNDISMKGNAFVPYMQMADAAGKALPVAREWNQSYIQNTAEGRLLDWNYYPLTDWQHQTSSSSASDILATATLDYRVVRGLNATINYQYERQFSIHNNFADENSFRARDYINRFAQVTDESVDFIVPKGGILDEFNTFLNTNNLRGQLNFENTYGNHNIIAIAGAEIRAINSNGHQERFYGYNPRNLTIGAVDYTTAYPNLPRGSSFIEQNQYLNETATRFVSQFANAAYTFDNRYVFSISARRDASNLFGLKTNDQWNPFWSAGLAWKVSNEKFYTSDFVPYFNIRTTYGFSGNIDPAMVAVNTISYSSENSFLNGEAMASFSNYYNPKLRWETSKMLNIGVDFHIKDNRLSGSVEFYGKKGENLFGVAPSDYTTGIPPSVIRNVASMSGRGWDIEFRSLNINRNLKWQTTLNLSIYRDRIEEYLISRTRAALYISNEGVPISGVNEHPVYAIYAYKWGGLDPASGEAQGYLNGEISKDYTAITGTGTKVEDLEYFGSAIPTKFGSVINAVSYKNISLQAGISFKLGYWLRLNSINYTELFNNWRGHSDYALRWQGPGDEIYTDVPVNEHTTNSHRDAFYNGSSVLVEKGDHIRLQYINIAYDLELPVKFRGGIKGLQIYINANNLGLLWKATKADIDPDFNIGLNNIVTPTNYAIGFRTKF